MKFIKTHIATLIFLAVSPLFCAGEDTIDKVMRKQIGPPENQIRIAASLFEGGSGFTRDLTQAYIWCRRVAMVAPSSKASLLLKQIESELSTSQKVEGVKELHVWFNISSAAGDATSKASMLLLEKEMTLEQRATAMDQARGAYAAIDALDKQRKSSIKRAIINNLRQLNAAADQYFIENNNSRTVKIVDLVGADKYVKNLNVVAGELYGPSEIPQNSEFIATMPDGTKVN